MTDTSVVLNVSADLPDARVAQLTRDLARDLSRTGIKARALEAGAAVPGEKGEPVTFGMLALALVTSGAVKALIGCLKAYVSREPALIIKIKHKDGTQVEVNARNVDAADVHAVLEAAVSAG
jgi:hypothetical protein